MELFNKFFIYSVFGHLLENIAMPSYTSGILYGYWTPVYGVGAIIIILANRYLTKKFNFKGFKKTLSLFLVCAVYLSCIEYIGGVLIEFIFHKTFWDYSKHKFNFGKYASLEMALTWGLLSLVLIYVIEPFINRLEKKIPKLVSYILIILFVIDVGTTIIFKTK